MAALAFAVLAVSCGGKEAGDTTGKNDILGVAPAVFVDIANEGERVKEETRKMDDYDDIRKRMDEYEEYKAKGYERAAEEGKKVIGNDVAFTGDPDEYLKVKEIKISDYFAGEGTGNFELRVKVEAKKDFVVKKRDYECAPGELSLDDTRLYYVALDADDKFIILGSLAPFSSNGLNMTTIADYQPGQTVKAGQLCNATGSQVLLSVHVADFSNFAKLHFLSKTDYENLRRQAYGY